MHWCRRNLWKVGIVIAGMLLILVLMVWVPVSAVGAYERASRLATPVTGTVQATPTQDTTVTALNKEKLAQEVQQLKNNNSWSWLSIFSTLGTLSTIILGIVVAWINFHQWTRNREDEQKKRTDDQRIEREKRAEDQRVEREKRDEERFQSAVEGLSSEREEAKIGAAILLRTFLRPGYEQFHTQIFDLAVAHLCPTRTSNSPENPKTPLPLTILRQALIVVFKGAFPLARSQNKGSPQSLDASYIQLDSAYLVEADLREAWMPETTLRKANLSGAKLIDAKLEKADLSEADLSGADLRGANLHEANLYSANLRGAVLDQADLTGANLKEADLSRAQCTGANLTGADLTNATLVEMSAVGAILVQASFWEASLMRANLMKANLTEARLMKADFTGAGLAEANLTGAYLMEAHLAETDFTQANLANANLSESNPEDARSLKGARMHFVRGLTPDQRKACAHQGAEWSILEDFVASPDRSLPLPERFQSQDDTDLFFPASTREGHSSPPPPVQSDDAQAPLTQGSRPPLDTGGTSATSPQPDPQP